jgi:phosphopantetheine--protein transferase-like protein
MVEVLFDSACNGNASHLADDTLVAYNSLAMTSIGIDLVYIPRFKKILIDTPRLHNKLFSFLEAGLNLRQLAGNFAAKEALYKALNTQSYFSHNQFSVVRDKNSGKPHFLEDDILKRALREHSISVSISNENDWVIASVVICHKVINYEDSVKGE